jgi:sporulation protein YlmC with PRC-barrel domain
MAKEMTMKRIIVIATTGILFGCAGMTQAPPAKPAPEPKQPAPPAQAPQPTLPGLPLAGSVPLGVTVVEMEAVFVGWSAKKDLLGEPVFNEKNEQIGKIDDLIIRPDSAVSYAIIGVGGFLGIGKRDVAIPMQQIKVQQDMLILPGATKEALKALPPFEYRSM